MVTAVSNVVVGKAVAIKAVSAFKGPQFFVDVVHYKTPDLPEATMQLSWSPGFHKSRFLVDRNGWAVVESGIREKGLVLEVTVEFGPADPQEYGSPRAGKVLHCNVFSQNQWSPRRLMPKADVSGGEKS